MNIELKEIEILIECKRLVENMLLEKRYILKRLDDCGKDGRVVQAQIERMERALEGKPPLTFKERLWEMES